MKFAPQSKALQDALRAMRPHFVNAGLFSALVNLLFIVPTLYMLQVYDRVVPTRGGTTLLLLTMVLLFALASLSLLDRLRSRLLVRASVTLDLRVSQPVLDAMIARPDLPGARQALRDLDTVRSTLSGPAMLALFDAPWMPIYVFVCFLVHPLIGAMALFGVIVLPLLTWLSERRTRTDLERAQQAAVATYALQDNLISSADAVRALGMRRAMVARQTRLRQGMLVEQTGANLAGSGYFVATRFLRLALQSLALGLGAWLAIHGSISAGAIFASSFLIARALQPIEQLTGSARYLAQAASHYRAIDELLLAVQDGHIPTTLPPPAGRLDLEGVTVLSENREAFILNQVSLSIRAGEVIAIVGPSGSGKSTLVRAICGARPADRGAVRFDGAASVDWSAEQLARHIGYVPQDAVLFAGTVAENIARFAADLGEDGDLVDAKVVAAAEAVGAAELIKHLPGGFDYRLGVGGRGLSAGQAQRIALARALYGDPAVLVLDEPNAHLDHDGDRALIGAIAAAKARKKTVLIVSHKLGILPVVDKILVLREGRAEMYGPRDEVLAKIMPPAANKRVPAQEGLA